MNLDNPELFQSKYDAGKLALERGQYRLSVQNLEEANQLVASSSQLGGEVQMWLVTAYQAVGRLEDAISLCRKLTHHNDLEIRKQSQQVLYIIEAPQLQRPREWMTEIPEIGNSLAEESRYAGSGSGSKKPSISPLKPVDFSQVNTKDNSFIWVALLAVLLALAGFLVL